MHNTKLSEHTTQDTVHCGFSHSAYVIGHRYMMLGCVFPKVELASTFYRRTIAAKMDNPNYNEWEDLHYHRTT